MSGLYFFLKRKIVSLGIELICELSLASEKSFRRNCEIDRVECAWALNLMLSVLLSDYIIFSQETCYQRYAGLFRL